MFLNTLVAPFAFKGSMNGDLFEGWFEQIFVPEIKNPGKSVVFMDNASHHNTTANTIARVFSYDESDRQ